jgi:anaerobic selenocysteine-containing dehydrogenase
MGTVPSACPLDCPDACSLEVGVEQGRLVSIGGSRVNPLTAGFICAKVRRFGDHVYAKERLLFPAIRRGEKGTADFARVSWDEALDRVARQLLSARAGRGGESIAHVSYGGSNGYLSQDTTDARLFRRLGASRLGRTVCAAPSGRAAEALLGKMPGVALDDYVHSRLIVVWGANPPDSGIHLMPCILEAQKRGARLVVVDPRRTEIARRADLHVAPRPGTDLPIALALIRWMFASGHADLGFLQRHTTGSEELRRRAEPWTFERAAEAAGVEPASLEMLAQWYAASSPAVIRCGWGAERNRNGGSAIAALLCLPAVGGKFGVRGGGYTMSNSGAWKLASLAAAAEPEAGTRRLNMNRLGEALLEWSDPPVELLFVYNCNPLATLPNQERVRRGLERKDLFTVVFDQVLTDTALYADVLLPATTFLERTELSRGYGAMVLQKASAAIEPVGEARSNHEVFAELCRRTGLSRAGDPETSDEILAAIFQSDPGGSALERTVGATGAAWPDFGPHPVAFVDVFPRTADQKIHLVPPELDREAPAGLYGFQPETTDSRYPLVLISPATDKTISSTLGELDRTPASIALHPADASAREITDGDSVRVWNDLGEVRCRARLDAEIRAGVVFLPKGLWSHHTENGRTANALVPDRLTDLGGGACFNDARVEVQRA